MPTNKTCKNRIYIPKKLSEKLSLFENYICTIVTAPTGFGKTTVLKHYFNLLDYRVIWINGDSSHELFWMNFYSAIESYNFDLAIQLSKIGIPTTDKEISMIILLLRKLNLEKTVLIIDDYYLVENEINNKLFNTLFNASIENFKIVFITRSISSTNLINLVLRDKVYHINKEDLKFQQEDIIEYFHLNELMLKKETAKELYDYSDGWPFVIKLQLLNYISEKNCEALESVTTFIKNDIWQLISEEARLFLIKICMFDQFSLVQAISASGLSHKQVTTLLDDNELIDYDYEKRTYCINTLYLKFIRKVFNDLSEATKEEITIATGKIYENNHDYFSAIRCYHIVKDYQSIYALIPQLHELYNYVIKENKQIFLDIANNYLEIEKHSHYEFAIILSFILFLYHENEKMNYLIENISKEVYGDQNIADNDRLKFQGELDYITAFSEYNNFSNMGNHFLKINNTIKEPLHIIAGQVPFSLGSPSILSIYHNQCGMLNNELNMFDRYAPDYYRITNGHGKGFEVIMKAEALYNRGEFNDSEILCHKAIYMADSGNQNSIYLCALLLLARLAICEGNTDSFKEYLNDITKRTIQNHSGYSQYNRMTDLARSFLYAVLCDKDNIADWLKGHKSIEYNTNFITVSFANIIYGKYLILNEQFHQFLGVSGQLLGFTNVFSYIIPRIYTYIYLVIANAEMKLYQKSRKFLYEAMALAIEDDIYMPFVENYSFIEILLNDTNIDITYSKFIKNINRLAKNYYKNQKVIQKVIQNYSNFGLTNRETEIAKLAAKRLSNKEIADTLFIADSTVKSNMKVIFNKLSINSRADLKKFFD